VDREYLQDWFDAQFLVELDEIALCVDLRTHGAIRNFMLLCLSNIFAQSFMAKADDLRVRRELKAVDEIDRSKSFLEETWPFRSLGSRVSAAGGTTGNRSF